MEKVIAIVGPTAVGKSSLAVELSLSLKKELGISAEIISADSRQVYKRLDIGSGKITESEMKGIPHHLLDVADPQNIYTVKNYVDDTNTAIEKRLNNQKIPIICGGNGFYIDSLINGFEFPEVLQNDTLRAKLEPQNTEVLFELLKKKDPGRAETIDRHNKVRIVRALEIIDALGKVPLIKTGSSSKFNTLYIGIDFDDLILKDRIRQRLKDRFDIGMIDEVKKLITDGISYERLESLGLEYRYIGRFLKDADQSEIAFNRMFELLCMEIWHYAKRQRTWFKRNKEIHWLQGNDEELLTKSFELVKKFIT